MFFKPKLKYTTTKEYYEFNKNDTSTKRMFLVVNPITLTDSSTMEVITIKPGEKLYLDKNYNIAEPYLRTYNNNFVAVKCISSSLCLPLKDNYFEDEYQVINKVYIVGKEELFDNTIPYDFQFKIQIKYKRKSFSYSINNTNKNLINEFDERDILDMFAYVIGFLKFSDDIMIHSFGLSLMEGLENFDFILKNNPSYYILNRAISEMKYTARDLYNESMKIRDKKLDYENWSEYCSNCKEKLQKIIQEDKIKKDNCNKMNEKILNNLQNKRNFFSAFRNC